MVNVESKRKSKNGAIHEKQKPENQKVKAESPSVVNLDRNMIKDAVQRDQAASLSSDRGNN